MEKNFDKKRSHRPGCGFEKIKSKYWIANGSRRIYKKHQRRIRTRNSSSKNKIVL